MKILLRSSAEEQWHKLEPFEFGGPQGEKTLEHLLEKSPDLLTIEGGKPPLFFKRQVALGNNAVDLMGVDADGKIVMVECKLEANREARRTVVGQILEYAGQLYGTSYEDFEEMLTGESGVSLVDMVRKQISDEQWTGADFRAAVERGLKSGDFRLVIAINGMNDELNGIIQYLKERGGVRLEALELQQFTDEKSGVAVLVPEMYGLGGRTVGTTSTNQPDFLSALDENGRAVFTRLLEFAKDHSMPVNWGTKGFSLNVDCHGTPVAVLFCYPPSSPFKQCIRTSPDLLGGVRMKTQVPETEISRLWSEAEAPPLFRPSGREHRCLIDRAFTDEEVRRVLAWCKEAADTVVKYGLKVQNSQ